MGEISQQGGSSETGSTSSPLFELTLQAPSSASTSLSSAPTMRTGTDQDHDNHLHDDDDDRFSELNAVAQGGGSIVNATAAGGAAKIPSTLKARSVIMATGAESRWLGVPGEDSFKGKG